MVILGLTAVATAGFFPLLKTRKMASFFLRISNVLEGLSSSEGRDVRRRHLHSPLFLSHFTSVAHETGVIATNLLPLLSITPPFDSAILFLSLGQIFFFCLPARPP